MESLSIMVNCFKQTHFFITICIILPLIFIGGCKYNGFVSLPEQIAIFENLGFEKLEPNSTIITLKNISLQINTTEDINLYLTNSAVDSNLNSQTMLYLQSTDNNIESLIFVYSFKNSNQAKNFYNHFFSTFGNDIFIYNNYVFQKGVNYHIKNGAVNYYYFSKFCNSLSNKKITS